MKGIEIGVASETKAYEQGIRSGVIKPTEDAVEALDELGKSKGPEQLERDLKDAQEQSEKLARETKQTADAIEQEYRRTYRGVGDNSKEATDKAKRGFEEMGDEARQSTRETVASFRDVEDVLDLIQELAANAFVGFGPAGFLAGAVAATGIGLAGAAIEAGQEETEVYKQRVSELGDQFIETGQLGEDWLGFIVEKLRELATETDAGRNLKRLSDIADSARSPFDNLAQAYAGNGDQLDALIRKEEELKKALEDQSSEIDTTTRAGAREYEQTIKQIAGKDDYLNKLREAKTAVDAATEAENLYAQSGGPELERKAELIQAVNDAYDKTAGSLDEYRDAETGLFDVAAYIEAMQARSQALADYQKNLTESGLSSEAKSFLNEQGADAAASFLAGYQGATPAQKAELNRIWTEAAATNSGTYSNQVNSAFQKTTLKGPGVDMQAPSLSPFLSAMQSQLDQRRLTVRVDPVDQYGRTVG